MLMGWENKLAIDSLSADMLLLFQHRAWLQQCNNPARLCRKNTFKGRGTSGAFQAEVELIRTPRKLFIYTGRFLSQAPTILTPLG